MTMQHHPPSTISRPLRVAGWCSVTCVLDWDSYEPIRCVYHSGHLFSVTRRTVPHGHLLRHHYTLYLVQLRVTGETCQVQSITMV